MEQFKIPAGLAIKVRFLGEVDRERNLLSGQARLGGMFVGLGLGNLRGDFITPNRQRHSSRVAGKTVQRRVRLHVGHEPEAEVRHTPPTRKRDRGLRRANFSFHPFQLLVLSQGGCEEFFRREVQTGGLEVLRDRRVRCLGRNTERGFELSDQ